MVGISKCRNINMSFDAESLGRKLRQLTAPHAAERWVVAFSGGIDSTSLLHALAHGTSGIPITAIHINHGLDPNARQWAERCASIASDIQVDFECIEVQVLRDSVQGPESAARHARYEAFRAVVGQGDCLLSAHHEADQAETLLLNLMRGSGVDGLAAIAPVQDFAAGRLLRPMLGVSDAEIQAYADAHRLRWVDDPSNSDTAYDRNYLRREIVPMLRERWPAASQQIARSAGLVGEARRLLRDLAEIDLSEVQKSGRLRVEKLTQLSPDRQRNALRHALRRARLPAPPATRLRQVLEELVTARPDAQPLVAWSGAEVRRYRGEIFLLPAPVPLFDVSKLHLQPDGAPLALGTNNGELRLRRQASSGIAPEFAADGLRVRYRSGGEKLELAGRSGSQSLKNLLQQAAILPWMRSRIPLLYAGERLVAVADLWIAADALATPGYTVEWTDRPPLI